MAVVFMLSMIYLWRWTLCNWFLNDTEYAGINIAFFLFPSFLLPLVPLRMLIALMGDTHGRAQETVRSLILKESADAL
jgi:hypothetical protein